MPCFDAAFSYLKHLCNTRPTQKISQGKILLSSDHLLQLIPCIHLTIYTSFHLTLSLNFSNGVISTGDKAFTRLHRTTGWGNTNGQSSSGEELTPLPKKNNDCCLCLKYKENRMQPEIGHQTQRLITPFQALNLNSKGQISIKHFFITWHLITTGSLFILNM